MTLMALTSNNANKGNITIQDHIIKTKLFKEWAVQKSIEKYMHNLLIRKD